MKRTHLVPLLSSKCDGWQCRACPRPWRYFATGMELWGHGDNATFRLDATEDYRRNPREKLSRARWRRVLRRWVTLGFPLLFLGFEVVARFLRLFEVGGFAAVPWLTVLLGYFVLAFLAAAIYGLNIFTAWLPVRHQRRMYLYPAGRTLARVTGHKFRRREAVEMIELPADFGAPTDPEADTHEAIGEPVRIYPHPDVVLDEGMKKRIEKEVGARLGMEECAGKWTVAGVERAFVELMPAGLPPAEVTLEELLEEMRASSIDRPVVGMANGRKITHMDFKNDSPHSLGSAASGAGKSTFYKFVAMQRLALGGYAIILDFKKWSHLRWAGRLPEGRVRIADEIPEIHDLLCKVFDELMWRKSHDLKDEAKLALLPTLDVYLEELGSLRDLLNDYWEALKQRRKVLARERVRQAKEALRQNGEEATDAMHVELEEATEELIAANSMPKKSPATEALKLGVNLGREFKIHFHFISQSIDANVAGGRNVRASFRTRFLARWDEADWKMLAKGIPFVRCPSGQVGIWAHVHGSEVEIVRVPFVDDLVAVEYVLDPRSVRPSLPMFHDDPMPSIDSTAVETVHPVSLPLSRLVEILPPKRDGSRITLDALRTASKRAATNGFPEPVEREYGPNEARDYPTEHVVAWFVDREGGRAAIGG